MTVFKVSRKTDIRIRIIHVPVCWATHLYCLLHIETTNLLVGKRNFKDILFCSSKLSLACVSFNILLPKVTQMIKKLPTVQETLVNHCVRKIPWRREWLPTLVFLPEEFHGQRSLEGYSPWSQKESDRLSN